MINRKVYVNMGLGVLFAAACFYLSAPVPVVELPKPKLAHHAVAFMVCGKPVGVLITTEPFVWHDVEDGPMPADIIDLMMEAHANKRALTVEHHHRGCSPSVIPIVPNTLENT